jgi:hypothetical protein
MLYHRFSLIALKLWLQFGLFRMRPFRSLKDLVYHHMESIGTKAYTKREVRRMFKQFSRVSVTPVLTANDVNRLPKGAAQYIPRSWGWFLVIQGAKK